MVFFDWTFWQQLHFHAHADIDQNQITPHIFKQETTFLLSYDY